VEILFAKPVASKMQWSADLDMTEQANIFAVVR
jgi:hypothetical protein